MKSTFFVVTIFTILVTEIYVAKAASKTPTAITIGDATTFCEREVPNYCISTTCPQFCDSIRSTNLKKTCKNECTVDKRCKLKPSAAGDQANNMALDAQNREQLWACIAEKRDPDNNKTGRNTTPWKQVRTPSFTHAVRP